MKTLLVRTLDQWRDWLTEHHASESEVWLIFHKRRTAECETLDTGRERQGQAGFTHLQSIDYQDAFDEAL
jgi:hypothetical protein